MRAFKASAGKCRMQQRKGASCASAACMVALTNRCSCVSDWRSSSCAAPAASASASLPADRHYAAPSSIVTKADFEHKYHYHFLTPNRYCRYGDIELYAPSEEGATAVLKAVAEPLVRCQRWLRLGNGLSHILLYELLKVFSALGGDRELVLAGSEELDALAHLKATPSLVHVPSHTKPRGHESVVVQDVPASCLLSPSSTSHDTLVSGGSGSSNRNGNGIALHPSDEDSIGSLDHSNDNANGNGYMASSTCKGAGSSNSSSISRKTGLSNSYSNGSSGNLDMSSNSKGSHVVYDYGSHGQLHHQQSGTTIPVPRASNTNTSHTNTSSSTNTTSSSSLSPPPPGFLLLRTSTRDHNPALEDTTTAGLLAALDSGAASPLLLVEINDGDGVSSSSSSSSEGRRAGSIRSNDREGGDDGDAPAAKYRLWARMMEAALRTRVSVPAGAAAATAGRYGSRRGTRHGGTQGNGNDGNGSSNVTEQARPIVVWGLLTDLKRWRFYCLREAPKPPDAYGSSSGGGSGKYEILGSRRVRVLDESMTAWPGLVPALAALYAITCTSDGLAVRRLGDVSQALTYDMPHDPHRDRLMHFHLIMGAAKAPLYGAVGDWVRRRLDEYVQCQREQKRLRHAAEATVQRAAAAVAAARAAAAVTVGGVSETSTSASLADGTLPNSTATAAAATAAGGTLPMSPTMVVPAEPTGPTASRVLERSADAGAMPAVPLASGATMSSATGGTLQMPASAAAIGGSTQQMFAAAAATPVAKDMPQASAAALAVATLASGISQIYAAITPTTAVVKGAPRMHAVAVGEASGTLHNAVDGISQVSCTAAVQPVNDAAQLYAACPPQTSAVAPAVSAVATTPAWGALQLSGAAAAITDGTSQLPEVMAAAAATLADSAQQLPWAAAAARPLSQAAAASSPATAPPQVAVASMTTKIDPALAATASAIAAVPPLRPPQGVSYPAAAAPVTCPARSGPNHTTRHASEQRKPLASSAGAVDGGEGGAGGLPVQAANSAEATQSYEGRLADARRQLAEAQERASKLRLRAQSLGSRPRLVGEVREQGTGETGKGRYREERA